MRITKTLLALTLIGVNGVTLAKDIDLMDYVTPDKSIKQVKINYFVAPNAYPYRVNGTKFLHDLTYLISKNGVTYKTYNETANLISTQTFLVNRRMITFTGDLGPIIWNPLISDHSQPYQFNYSFPRILKNKYQNKIDNGHGLLNISQLPKTSKTPDCIKIAFIQNIDFEAGESYADNSEAIFCKGSGFLQSDYKSSNVIILQSVEK